MIVKFDFQFDATHMTPDQIRREARSRGWPGIRLNADEWATTGKLIARRLSEKHAWGKR